MNEQELKKVNLAITGMTCASCEVLLERKFKKVPGVEQARVNHSTGKAELYCSREPSLSELQDSVSVDGYKVSLAETISGTSKKREYAEIGAIFLILVGVYLLLKRFDLIPSTFSVTDNVSYGVAFGMGLVAAVSTCLAITGGLLVAVSAKYAENHPELNGYQKFRPHLYFNMGRVVSYTVLGAGVGALGSLFTLSSTITGLMTIAISIIMIFLGFQLLGIFPWIRKFQPKMPKFIAHKIYDNSASDNPATPFLFGGLTFFLPCGFTQALQLYVLSQGNVVTGALTMLAFSLGTLPALLSLGAVSSFVKGTFRQYFLKTAGAMVILLGIFSLSSGFVLTGSTIAFPSFGSDSTIVGIDSAVPLVDGRQIAEMEVRGIDYYPASFTVKQGIPVQWKIDGSKAQGCARVLSAPPLGVLTQLRSDTPNIIEFTPTQAGTIRFTCSMGMAGPGEFVVVP